MKVEKSNRLKKSKAQALNDDTFGENVLLIEYFQAYCNFVFRII